MSGAADALQALVARLRADPALAIFTITDRPARPDELPHLRIGPLEEKPWDTGSSAGLDLTIALDMTSRTGTFAPLHAAVNAIAAALRVPLTLAAGASIVQRIERVRLNHEPAQDLESASLSITLLIDLGDAA